MNLQFDWRSLYLLFLVLISPMALWGNPPFPYLTSPPKGWECINDPAQLPTKVKVIFIGPGHGNSQFTPSLNVACEETRLPIDEYVSMAKMYHEKQAGTRCTPLGTINTPAGVARLMQIDRPSQWGDVRFIQAMLIKDGDAYVATATCLKSDFSVLSTQIFKALQSFNIDTNNSR